MVLNANNPANQVFENMIKYLKKQITSFSKTPKETNQIKGDEN